MSKEFLNKFNNPTSRFASMFVTTSEEEFTDVLRNSGWSDSAIEKELESLREYKKIFKLEIEKQELEEETENELAASILRIRKKRQ